VAIFQAQKSPAKEQGIEKFAKFVFLGLMYA